MDYSLRNVAIEMVYVPLDFESRYLGKEIIGVFGNRFGKSGMSLLLSVLSYTFGTFGIRELSALSTVASFSWLSCSVRLSQLLPKRKEAEAAVEQRRRQQQQQQQVSNKHPTRIMMKKMVNSHRLCNACAQHRTKHKNASWEKHVDRSS